MSITINFTASTDSDISTVKVWEASSSNGEFSFVYSSGITTSSTSVTYSSGVATNWYRLSFVDTVGNESALSEAVYGGGTRWSDYMVPLFRVEIGDIGTTQKYTDLQLKKKLVVAGSQLYNMALPQNAFDYTYSFTIDAGDGSAWDVSPDPIYTSKDVDFVNLWILKSLCSEAKTGLINASVNAIKVKDGDSSIDTSASFGGYKNLLESEGGPCKAFAEAWKRYLYQNTTHSIYTNFGADYIGSDFTLIDRD